VKKNKEKKKKKTNLPEFHWNHRVIYHAPNPETKAEEWFGIHEVHYEKGIPTSLTVDPIDVMGETVSNLKQTLDWMESCLKKPILLYDSFPGCEKKK